MRLVSVILFLVLDLIPSGKAFLEPLQKRDSALVADQFEYGVSLKDVAPGTVIGLPDFEAASNDTLSVVRGWKIDTLSKPRKPLEIRASVVLSPFEEGKYELPGIPVKVESADRCDTLVFEPVELEVFPIQIDTATFVIKDIKGLRTYPLTFVETVPWIIGLLLLAAVAVLIIRLVRKHRRQVETASHKDPPHIVALRKLDRYRGDKYWAPEKQKLFYSGITDALREYIDERFGIDAPEMTTAEIFCSLKGSKAFSPELYGELKALFETADFVKFAKMTVGDEENAKALPLAVRFVTETYQTGMEEENNVL